MPSDFTPDPAAVECAAEAAWTWTFIETAEDETLPSAFWANVPDEDREQTREMVSRVIVALVTEGHMVPIDRFIGMQTIANEGYRTALEQGRGLAEAQTALAEAVDLLRRTNPWLDDDGLLAHDVDVFLSAHPEVPDA